MKLNFAGLGYFALAIVSGLFYGFSGAILKKGAVDLKLTGGLFGIVREVVTSKFVLFSIFLSGVGYLITMFILRRAEVVTTTLIIQGVLFAATMVFAALMFRETVTVTKIIALVLIMAGIGVLVTGK
jgi:multidrug transporter EmrE-like cation transporter